MGSGSYRYTGTPTRNPFRYALAVWRLISRPSDDAITDEAAIVEIGFARSGFGRRLARWDELLTHLRQDPAMAETIGRRACIGPINLEDLETLPAGSLGRVFADHCRSRGIDPNLVHIAPEDEESWLLNHLFETHDVWHVVTGWPNDGRGEVGLAGFYCGQLHSPAFFAFLLSLVILKTVWRKESASELFDAFVSGYRDGQRTRPLFGTAWNELWQEPLATVRARFDYSPSESPSENGYGISSQAA